KKIRVPSQHSHQKSPQSLCLSTLQPFLLYHHSNFTITHRLTINYIHSNSTTIKTASYLDTVLINSLLILEFSIIILTNSSLLIPSNSPTNFSFFLFNSSLVNTNCNPIQSFISCVLCAYLSVVV